MSTESLHDDTEVLCRYAQLIDEHAGQRAVLAPTV